MAEIVVVVVAVAVAVVVVVAVPATRKKLERGLLCTELITG
jgi:hypothetical protein